jgi:hypothetical protein
LSVLCHFSTCEESSTHHNHRIEALCRLESPI